MACYNRHCPGNSGTSPSGKALGFGPSIRRFESCRPSQVKLNVDSRPNGRFLGWRRAAPTKRFQGGDLILIF